MSGQWLSRPKGRQAQLPGLPAVPRAVDAEVGNWMRKVAERLEVREGQRGDPKERAVTVREFERANVASHYLSMEKKPGPGEIGLELGGGLTATINIEKFIDAIRGLPLFKDLVKSLDDPSRFDHLPGQIRQIVLQDIAEEARKRGADIRRVELVQRERFSQLAAAVQELTAAVGDSAAGLRELSYAYADGNSAMAGKITQLQASLGKFYLDGSPGRVALEQEMRVQADRITGLRGQYTLKVQAGKAIAGFGLAASDNGTGGLSSAFIVAAEKFAIVNPATYTGGLTTTPAQAHIPFGVDSHGIYLNHNVYIRGNVRIDTGGKRLIDGLRGSVNIYRGGAWSDAAASAAVWQELGKTGSPPNSNHLVIGDTVTFTYGSTVTTKAWMGSSWRNPGMVLNGNLLVDGSVAAQKIDTRGLTIKDNAGRVILDAGSVNFNLINHIAGLTADKVTGLGAMATQNHATIGSTVRFPSGQVLGEDDFVSKLTRISSGNISTFMEGAAITNAYIGYAAVGMLSIAGGSVTTMHAHVANDQYYNSSHPDGRYPAGVELTLASVIVLMPSHATGAVLSGHISCNLVTGGSLDDYEGFALRIRHADGRVLSYTVHHVLNLHWHTVSISAFDPSPQVGSNIYRLTWERIGNARHTDVFTMRHRAITAVGGKR